MKKSTIIFTVLFFGIIANSMSQGINIEAEILKDSEGTTFVKNFDINLKSLEEKQHTILLSNNNYAWFSFQNEANQLQFTLFDTFGKKRFEKISDSKGGIHFILKIDKTEKFILIIKNKSKKEINSTLHLTLVDEDYTLSDLQAIHLKSKDNNNSTKETNNKNNSDDVFFIVEDMPKFNGKDSKSFKDYIKKELKYPRIALKNGIEGKVIVQFIVDKNGYVKNAKIVREAHPSLNQEALRVIYSSPKWEPGKQRGQNVPVMFTFPITFHLDKK